MVQELSASHVSREGILLLCIIHHQRRVLWNCLRYQRGMERVAGRLDIGTLHYLQWHPLLRKRRIGCGELGICAWNTRTRS